MIVKHYPVINYWRGRDTPSLLRKWEIVTRENWPE
jgi:hypothetical protein